MIHALLLLLACQLVGEVTSRALGLPLPGPVLGMLLMLGILVTVPKASALMRPVAGFILANLSLLFVPAGVGVVAYLGVLRQDGLAILLAVALSTVAAIVVGALAFTAVARMTGNSE
ncbi:CidA/LrgA family protein [Falsirhodobacter xinxiangensis]|uniref:CidA/LrgA family protein n=1 Tax=Falsirhodobacter xinxiangensis TaxID=2530049 RepID=UPI0010AA70B4|nr:CidA/LrgA family protein [Rhodobacter xinxiangensis]